MEQTEKIIEIPKEYKRLFDNDWREAAIYWGRFSLKSHTVARYLLIMARQNKTRVWCFREYQNSIRESSHQLLSDLINLYWLSDFQITNNSIINTINGSDFIFKGLWNNEQSVKSIEGIDIAWVEEAQTISKESIDVLTPTIRKDGSKIVYTYNRLLEDDPVHTRLVIEWRPNTLVLNVNYDIAIKYGMMPEVIRLEMEDDKLHRPSLYKHKWLWEPNSLEKKIYKDWAIIDEIPHEARLERYGVDFGYTNDPTAIVALYTYNGGYILDEITFQKGLSNKQIADIILNYPQALVIADSAEPKSIDEIKSYWLTILPCEKWPDSIKNWIQLVQGQRISVTKNSTNIIKEYRNYMWMTDRDGKIINVPEGWYDHCFAPETLVFTTEWKKRIDELVGKEWYVYSRWWTVQKFFNVRQSGGKNEVVTLYFDDGDKITTTKEHLLLNTQGEWVQAWLLKVMDSIQWVMYEATTNISRESIYSSQMRKVYEQMTDKIASGCMGVLQWYNTKMNAYTSCWYEPPQQWYFQSCNEDRTSSSLWTHDRRETRESKKVGRSDTTTNKGMARLKGMTRMAQQAWERSIQKSCSCIKWMQSLSQNLWDYTVSEDGKILLKQLQNESKEKKITRITRGFRSKVYDLEVENTQCFIANWVVAHNSMDAIRYWLTNLLKTPVSTFDTEKFLMNEQREQNILSDIGL